LDTRGSERFGRLKGPAKFAVNDGWWRHDGVTMPIVVRTQCSAPRRQAEPTMRVIYACDVGSTRPNTNAFAWVRCLPDPNAIPAGSSSIEGLVQNIINDARAGRSIALGFESPLFIPEPLEAENLSRGREGEADRSFAAPAGGYVATLGVHQSAWILRELFQAFSNTHRFTTAMDQWPPSDEPPVFFCWEAFVSGRAHSEKKEHIRDAATAVMAFISEEQRLEEADAVTAGNPLSLIHAVALWSGWSTDIGGLHGECLVIKPEQKYPGSINTVK
jgi:hypothetical protein